MRDMAAGLLSALALALCLAGALAGDAAPAAAAAGAPDVAEIQREMLRMQQELQLRIQKLEQRAEQAEASSRRSSAALRAFGPEDDFVELAEGGNHTGKRAVCEGNLTKEVCTKKCHGQWKDGKCDFFQDKMVAAFKAMKQFGTDYIGPVLLSDTLFFIAIFLVLQWHMRFHLGDFLCKELYARVFGMECSPREAKPMMMPRRLGLNILILGIYYDDSLPGSLDDFVAHRPFFCSIGLVFLDTVAIYYFFMILGTFINTEKYLPKEWVDPLDEKEDDGRCPEKYQADNVYEDLTIKFRRALPIWIVQMCLVAFYIEELNSDKDTKERKNVDFNYWIVAIIFQMHAGDEQVGEAFNTKYWMHILKKKPLAEQFHDCISGSNSSKTGEPLLDREDRLKSALEKMQLCPRHIEKFMQRAVTDEDVKIIEEMSDSKDYNEDPEASATMTFFQRMEDVMGDEFKRILCLETSLGKVGSMWHKVFWVLDMEFHLEWQLRCFMDFTVNSVARSVILYTVPIMVCVEGPLDFVKDLTAVMFITMIDNIDGDPKDIAEILAKLKYAVHCGHKKGTESLWTTIRKACGGHVEVEPQEVCLNMFEKKFIEGHDDNFGVLATVAGDEWKEFRLMGIPISKDELDAEEKESETNALL